MQTQYLAQNTDSIAADDLQVSGLAGASGRRGVLIMNADDWGRDCQTTQRILDCILRGTVSATSAMVFMEDTERSAAIARERRIDAGLHVNFTTPFSAPGCSHKLLEHQTRIARYLRRHRAARLFFHPGLSGSFRYVMQAQLDEYCRLYGQYPRRVDGHHHMHLCANVLFGKLLPAGVIVRRTFSIRRAERSWFVHKHRQWLDRVAARRHPMTDRFYSLPPLEPVTRLETIFSLSRRLVVEVETHPVNPDEYRFLTGDGVHQIRRDLPIATGFLVPYHSDYRAIAVGAGT